VNATPMTEPEARALADAINQVSSSQPPGEALKLVEMALTRAPQQPLVLNAAGGHMYRTGNAARARQLFERAISLDGRSKALWLNLAAACRLLGDQTVEAQAIEKALELEPRYVLALLQKGDLMERQGKPKAAALAFGGALACVASGAPVPPNAAAALQHAQEVTLGNNRDLASFLEKEVESVRKAHAGEDLHRYDACRDILLGKRRVYTAAPKDLLFPYLPAIEFFPRTQFPWLELLEAATDDITAEAEAVFRGDRDGFAPYVNFPAGTPVDEWGPLNHSMDWSVYTLWHDSAPIADHIARCPGTAAVLAQLPLCDIPNYAPGAYFSVLKPRTRLPPHTGTTNSRSIVHLPLVIPPGCQFRVGSDTRAWEKGRAWVFDDTLEHEAWNDSDQTRIILIFDIWNPLLSAAERDLVRAVTMGLGKYYGGDAPEMGSR